MLWLTLFAFPATTEWWSKVDHTVLNWFVDIRSDAATTVMKWLQLLGSLWVIRPIRWTTIIILAVYKRWRALIGVILAFVIFLRTGESFLLKMRYAFLRIFK